MTTGEIVGFWVAPNQYRMYDPRTNIKWMVLVPGAELLDGAEVEDVVAEANEEFAEYVKTQPAHQAMPLDQQHELAPHLREIAASKRRAREVGHGRYW